MFEPCPEDSVRQRNRGAVSAAMPKRCRPQPPLRWAALVRILERCTHAPTVTGNDWKRASECFWKPGGKVGMRADMHMQGAGAQGARAHEARPGWRLCRPGPWALGTAQGRNSSTTTVWCFRRAQARQPGRQAGRQHAASRAVPRQAGLGSWCQVLLILTLTAPLHLHRAQPALTPYSVHRPGRRSTDGVDFWTWLG